MTTVEEFLEHHGVKGMKWGKRKQKTPPRLSVEGRRTQEIIDKANKHGFKSLTNHELSQLNKRMELEKKFSSTMTQNKSSVQNGQKFVKQFIGVDATAVGLYAFYKSPAGQALKDTISTHRDKARLIKSANNLLKDVI